MSSEAKNWRIRALISIQGIWYLPEQNGCACGQIDFEGEVKNKNTTGKLIPIVIFQGHLPVNDRVSFFVICIGETTIRRLLSEFCASPEGGHTGLFLRQTAKALLPFLIS